MFKHPLINNITKDYSNLFIIKDYKKGSLIFNELDKCNYLALILEGEIQISTLTYNDKEYTITLLNKFDTFGEFLLFSDTPFYLGDIIARSNTKLALINKENLLILLKDKTVLENYLNLLSKKSMLNQEKIKIYSQNNIEDRILFYLFEESKKRNTKTLIIKSKENLALLLNIPRPSLSRSLIKLKEKSLIEYNRYSITLKV